MKNYATRHEDELRHCRRRFNAFFGWDNDAHRVNVSVFQWRPDRKGGLWSDTPSLHFLYQNPRLLVIYRVWERIWFAKHKAWATEQHGCSCYMCTREKRKWNGNAWGAKPMQERRELSRMNDDAEATTTKKEGSEFKEEG